MSACLHEILDAKYASVAEMTRILKVWHDEETDIVLRRELYMAIHDLEGAATRFLDAKLAAEGSGP